ncbi:MAG: RsmE family RNA methyltransferase [Gemmatimonadaceae bacterium]
MSLPTFVTDEPFGAPSTVTLGEEAAHHMRVRRLEHGARVRLLDGAGTIGEGVVTQLAKRHATVSVESADRVEPATAIHLLLPVADRDRMLWLAEKATELGVSSWRPVVWRRSRHVTPRGEGTVFQQKARARMVGALAQSGGAWLPVMFPDATLETAVASVAEGRALVLAAGAPPILDVLAGARAGGATGGARTVTLAVGPEGGFEEGELAALKAGGFRPASLGASVLRFETAAVAGIAAARAALDANR